VIVSHIVLRGRWCNIIVLSVHATSEERSDDSKEIICEELEQLFDHFPKYHMNILLGELNANWVERIISNPLLGMRISSRIVMIMVLE